MILKEQLLVLYSDILRSIGYIVDEDGMVSRHFLGKTSPAVFDEKGRRLVLPFDSIMARSQWDQLQAFHPLCESGLRGESPVLRKLRSYINFRITSVLSILMSELMEIATDSKRQKQLPPSASEYLMLLHDVDDKSPNVLIDVIKAIQYEGKNRLVSVYLKRGGVLGGVSYTRTAITSFPIHEELENDELTIYGVKVRVKDKKAITGLLNWILPASNDMEEYSYGSLSSTAPYFHALMGAYLKVAKRINAALNKFNRNGKNVLACYGDVYSDLSWEEAMKDLAKFRDVIPALDGNEGEADPNKASGQPTTAVPPPPVQNDPRNIYTPPPAISYQPPPQQQPQPAPQQQPERKGGFSGSPLRREQQPATQYGQSPMRPGQQYMAPATREQLMRTTDDWETFTNLRVNPGAPAPMFRGTNTPQNNNLYGNNNGWNAPPPPTPWSNLPPQIYQQQQPQPTAPMFRVDKNHD